MEDNLERFLKYVKSDRGFERLFMEMHERYRKFGSVVGSVTIKQATVFEKYAIGELVGKKYTDQCSISISMERLANILNRSGFTGFTLEEAVKGYFGENIKSKREEYLEKTQLREQFFLKIAEKYEGTKSGNWLRQVMIKKGKPWQYISRYYNGDKEYLTIFLNQALIAGNNFPIYSNSYKRLPVFAYDTVGDSHAFDLNEPACQLLLYQIANFTNKDDADLLYEAGILKDEILNNTMAFGISCMTKDGIEHPGTAGFCLLEEPIVLTLRLLLQTTCVKTNGTKKVYILESQGVFATLVEKTAKYNPMLICTNGTLNNASKMLIDKLYNQRCELYYAGDFVPESMQTADRLARRYSKLHLWKYEVSDYEKSLSNIELSSTKLCKLKTVKTEALDSIVKKMRETRTAGYQENLVEDYIIDIKNCCT